MSKKRYAAGNAVDVLQASKRLGLSVRDLQRRMSRNEIRSRKETRAGRIRTVIGISELERLEELARLEGATKLLFERLSIGLTMARESGAKSANDVFVGMPDYFRFWPAGTDQPSDEPNFDLDVSLADFHRFVRGSREVDEYERIRLELRQRLRGKPDAFAIRFVVDPNEAYKYLRALVRRVKPPSNLAREVGLRRGADSIRETLVAHLMTQALPKVRTAENLEAYLVQAAKNFLKNQLREDSRADSLADEDVDELIANRLRATGRLGSFGRTKD